MKRRIIMLAVACALLMTGCGAQKEAASLAESAGSPAMMETGFAEISPENAGAVQESAPEPVQGWQEPERVFPDAYVSQQNDVLYADKVKLYTDMADFVFTEDNCVQISFDIMSRSEADFTADLYFQINNEQECLIGNAFQVKNTGEMYNETVTIGPYDELAKGVLEMINLTVTLRTEDGQYEYTFWPCTIIGFDTELPSVMLAYYNSGNGPEELLFGPVEENPEPEPQVGEKQASNWPTARIGDDYYGYVDMPIIDPSIMPMTFSHDGELLYDSESLQLYVSVLDRSGMSYEERINSIRDHLPYGDDSGSYVTDTLHAQYSTSVDGGYYITTYVYTCADAEELVCWKVYGLFRDREEYINEINALLSSYSRADFYAGAFSTELVTESW